MNKFVILTDVTCDLSKELRDEIGMNDYIKGHIHFSDGRDFQTTLDWTEISRKDFYKALSNKKTTISTAPASPEEYYECFKKYVMDGYDILSMSISSKISSTYNVAASAGKRVMEEFPESRICCIDTRRMSGSMGLLVMYAYDMQKNGKSMQEIIDWLEENRNKVHQMGPIDDLMFIARRGRISTGKAIMGSFAGVKPMGDCSRDGYVNVLTKAKGMKNALRLTVEYIKLTAKHIEDQYILISHSDREEYANTLKELIEKELNPKKIFISDVFCGCGTNIGPGMIGAYYLGDEISADSSVEKEFINQAIENCKNN